MTMDLLDLYRDMLKEGYLEADQEGFIYRVGPADEREPYHVNKHRLVLPTPNQLAVADANNRLFFHPLMENQLRGESKVLTDYRERVNEKLNITISAVVRALMRLATSPAEHPKLTPDQTEFLSAVKEADNGTLERLDRIMKAMPLGDPAKCFVHIYIKRGGMQDGKKRMRLGVVSFPLYEELSKKPVAKEKNEVWGVAMRGKDRDIIMAFLRYLLPGVDQASSFYRGSDSNVAPSLEALMAVVVTIGDAINTQLDLFEPYFKDAKLHIGGAWTDIFQNTEVMLKQIRAIPMQAGNEGAVPQTGSQAPKLDMRAVNNPIPQQQQQPAYPGAPMPPQQQPTAPAPAPVANKAPERLGGVYKDVKKEPTSQGGLNMPAQAQAPAPAAYTAPAPAPIPPMHLATPNNPYGGPVYQQQQQQPPANPYAQQFHQGHQPPMQPGYPQPYPSQQGGYPQQQQAPAVPMRTANGIDVNAMFMNRPDLAQRAGYVPPGYQAPNMGGYGGPQAPRWAQPVYGQQPMMQPQGPYGQPQPQYGYGQPQPGYGYGV